MAAEEAGFVIDGQKVPVRFLRHVRARRIVLRIDERNRGLVVVLPSETPRDKGLAFARDKLTWVAKRLSCLPRPIPFAAGETIPLLGVPHCIRHEPVARRGVWADDGVIHVSGDEAFLARRLGDWLKQRARLELVARAMPMAAALGVEVSHVVIGEFASRWGSCTAKGRLAFSWRLVLAPPGAVSYLAAHEVAHLLEMNHSPAFWRLVASLAPDAGAWRTWLRQNGRDLHRYG